MRIGTRPLFSLSAKSAASADDVSFVPHRLQPRPRREFSLGQDLRDEQASGLGILVLADLVVCRHELELAGRIDRTGGVFYTPRPESGHCDDPPCLIRHF
jgi:hypothetical protein